MPDTIQRSENENQKKNVNKPADTRLKQQKLKAWQPILTAGTVLPVFFFIGFVFIPIGAALLIASNNVFEYVHDYTDCEDASDPTRLCKDRVKEGITNCRCVHTFSVEETVNSPIYVYYGLSNFYQNHRRYVKSRDDRQLLGDTKSAVDECAPFQYANQSVKVPIVPCGAIANSMFNDSFYLTFLHQPDKFSADTEVSPYGIVFNYSEIAWPSDRHSKFKNPANMDDFDKVAKPVNWKKPINKLSAEASENGFQNESFIVWMRISALPTFRKLYSRITNNLSAGNYSMSIEYNYPVDMFDGRKRFIISTTSWAGGRNPFLGIAYIIVGCLCVLTGTVFFFIHLKYGKSLTEMANINR